MGFILRALKSPPALLAIGGLITLAADARTGGKVTKAVAGIPLLGKVVFG